MVEEVAIRKKETERTETVRDKVRREDLEVTDKDGENESYSIEIESCCSGGITKHAGLGGGCGSAG